MGLVKGSLVRYDDRVWLVGLVNNSRARLDPVQGTIHNLLGSKFETYGKSVNVSADAILPTASERDLTDSQRRRAQTLQYREQESFVTRNEGEDEMATATVEQPVTGKPKAVKPTAKPTTTTQGPVAQPGLSDLAKKKEAQKTAKAASKEAKAAAAADQPGAPAKEPKAPKTLRPCACGCVDDEGNRVMVPNYFYMGHDARFKGWMVKVERGKMAVKDLPPAVQAAYKFVKRGEGYVTTKNYKGEAHDGYDKKAQAAVEGEVAGQPE